LRHVLALKAAEWVRRARFAMIPPDWRRSRRYQTENPLIAMSEFPKPALGLPDSGGDTPSLREVAAALIAFVTARAYTTGVKRFAFGFASMTASSQDQEAPANPR